MIAPVETSEVNVVVVQKDVEYLEMLQSVYHGNGHLGSVHFCTDLSVARALLEEGKICAIITYHRPDVGFDSQVMARHLKALYPGLVHGMFAYTVTPINSFDALDGWIPKPLAHEGGCAEVCDIIGDLACGMGTAELLSAYPVIRS